MTHPPSRPLVQRIQSELFIMGADVATPHEPRAYTIPRITPDHAATYLSPQSMKQTQKLARRSRTSSCPGARLPQPRSTSARAVCRRAERIAVALAQEEPLSKPILIYLNRLSDLLFTLARLANHLAGTKDVLSKDTLSPE